VDEHQPPAALPWDETQSMSWLAQLQEREASLVPVLDALLDRADLQPGERVLDIGCGAGPSTLAAARLVGTAGRVTGLDVSTSMLTAARDRSAAVLRPEVDAPVDWLLADAQTCSWPDRFDVLISRFGVMFFADPQAAFANLAAACVDEGRLVMAVWPHRTESEWFNRPLEVVGDTLARHGVTMSVPPNDGGPFALGDVEQLTGLLSAAGWSQVDVRRDDRLLYHGGAGASDRIAVESLLGIGPIRAAVEGQSAELVDAVRQDLLRACARWRSDLGVGLVAGFLVVSARR
jgi:SAM-dependent methyltransferase